MIALRSNFLEASKATKSTWPCQAMMSISDGVIMHDTSSYLALNKPALFDALMVAVTKTCMTSRLKTVSVESPLVNKRSQAPQSQMTATRRRNPFVSCTSLLPRSSLELCSAVSDSDRMTDGLPRRKDLTKLALLSSTIGSTTISVRSVQGSLSL
jgi:hypothetical protein